MRYIESEHLNHLFSSCRLYGVYIHPAQHIILLIGKGNHWLVLTKFSNCSNERAMPRLTMFPCSPSR